MDISIFLAKALAIYFIVVSLSLLINGAKMRDILEDCLNDKTLLFILGILALIVGILMVLVHNIWVADWRVVITLLAWASLLKGIARVVFIQRNQLVMKVFVENHSGYLILSIVTLLIGLFLAYHGFMINHHI
jgi:hypothetical protein